MDAIPDIADLRAALGLSQEALAERIGVNRSNISRWEAGQTRPSGPAKKLLAALAEQARKKAPAARGVAA